MTLHVVELSGPELVGSEAFHETFSGAFGFPEFYGRNMNAWMDCMGSLRDPLANMTKVHISTSETLAILIHDFEAIRETAPEQWLDLIECAAFVNRGAINRGEAPLLALAF